VKKLAHVRSLGFGNRIWASPRYIIPGVSLSHAAFNLAQVNYNEGFSGGPSGGSELTHRLLGPVEPSTTRRAEIASQFSSLAALPSFQSFGNLHWSNGLAGVMARPDHPALNANFNPNTPGSKEQQRATTYDPWPSAGALYPKAI